MSGQCVAESPAGEELAAGEVGQRRGLYYGWVMLPLATVALIASSPGQTFGVSIFNESMRVSLGLTHAQLAMAYMLGTILGALPITYIGLQMDRRGLRWTLLAVVTLFSAACLLTALVQNWVMLVLAFCLLRMLGPGALSLLSGSTLAFWFDRRLGMVEGLRQLGMAGAMICVPAICLWLLTSLGWRGAYAMLGAGLWIVLFPTFMLFFRNRPAELGQRVDGASHAQRSATGRNDELDWGLTLNETLRTPAFWIVTSGTATFGLVLTGVFFCIVPIFQERGLSATDAAATLSTFAACLAVMQLTGGILADRVRTRLLLCSGMAGLAIAMVLLHSASTAATALTAGAVLGISQGIFFGATHPLWARYFGRRHLGKIRGVLLTLNVASSSLGPLLAGTIRDVHGEFALALALFAVMPLPIAVLSLLVVPPRRSVHRSPTSVTG